MYPSQLEILTKLDNGIFNTTLEVDKFCYVYTASLVIHFAAYYFSHHILQNILKIQSYIDLKPEHQADYLSRITAQLHALVTCIAAYIILFYNCGEGKDVFNDTDCFFTPTWLSIYTLAFSFGYLSYDLYIIFMDIRDFSALGL
jgi:hypothetical protein